MNMNDWAQIALAIFRAALTVVSVVVAAVVIPWLRNEFIPWLKERRMYSTVTRLVQAAEKLWQYDDAAGNDKYKYVVDILKGKGVEITDEVAAYIESAVKELDLVTMGVMNGVTSEFHNDEDDTDIVDFEDEDERRDD